MIYLGLATMCSASIALLFKLTETGNRNRYVVTMANYVIASSIAIFMILTSKSDVAFSPSFFRDSTQLESDKILVLGIITGVFFFFGFIFYQKSVRDAGASMASMFGKLGILLPMVLSVVVWREFPTGVQWFGILLALSAIILVNLGSKTNTNLKAMSLYMLFIFGGFGDFCNKIFQKYALSDFKPYYLMFVFGTAFFICLSVIIYKKIKIKASDMLLGAIVGFPNLFASFFLIEALRSIPATIVFPIYSAGSILLVMLLSYLIFKEHISRKGKIAILMTLISLILIQ